MKAPARFSGFEQVCFSVIYVIDVLENQDWLLKCVKFDSSCKLFCDVGLKRKGVCVTALVEDKVFNKVLLKDEI